MYNIEYKEKEHTMYNKGDKIEHTFVRAGDGIEVTHTGTVIELRGMCLIYTLDSTTDDTYISSPIGTKRYYDTRGAESILVEKAKPLGTRSTTIDRVQARADGEWMSTKELATKYDISTAYAYKLRTGRA